MRNFTLYIILSALILALASSCKTRKKDCRGRRKTVKTDMGGWL